MNLQDIKFNYWQPSINNPGGVVQAVGDIAQCIRVIVTTVKGSDPLRPDFGTDVFSYQDKPVNSAIPNVIKEIIEGINTFEPRAIVRRVVPVLAGSHLTVSIFWEPAQKNLLEMLPEELDGSKTTLIDVKGIGVMVIETTFKVF